MSVQGLWNEYGEPQPDAPSGYYWLIQVPLIVGASIALLKYAGWSAVCSGYYGLPSEAWRLKEAGTKAELYWWVLMALAVNATILATILIPPIKSDNVPTEMIFERVKKENPLA